MANVRLEAAGFQRKAMTARRPCLALPSVCNPSLKVREACLWKDARFRHI